VARPPAAILVALALSFANTKILTFRRKSIEYEQRITELRKSRARSLSENSVPAMFAKATISQCEKFRRLFWLSGAKVIDDPASPNKAYERIRVRVTTSDGYLDKTVLFKHLLAFEWEITIPRERDWRWYNPYSWLQLTESPSAHTTEPQVSQYSPLPGKLTTIVTIKRGGHKIDEIKVNRESIPIGKSPDFAWQRAFAATEVFAFVLATIFAIRYRLGGVLRE
jgi:hypothetical protein